MLSTAQGNGGNDTSILGESMAIHHRGFFLPALPPPIGLGRLQRRKTVGLF